VEFSLHKDDLSTFLLLLIAGLSTVGLTMGCHGTRQT